MTIEEAQAKFLTQYASYHFTFGSYFTIRRKTPNLMTMQKNTGKISNLKQLSAANSMINIQGRRKTPMAVMMAKK